MVTEFVRGIGRKDDRVRGIRRGESHVRHVLADDGLVPQVHAAQESDLLVGRCRTDGLIDKPGIAQGRFVIYRSIVTTDNDIPGIQRIKNRSRRKSGLHLIDGFRLLHGPVDGIDLTRQIVFDEILVPLEFRRGVTAHALVVVRGDGGVEHVDAEVQDPVGRIRVGLDHLVHGTLGERFAEVLRGGEMVGVQVAFAGGEKVHRDEGADSHAGDEFAVTGRILGQKGPEEEPPCHGNQDEGDEGVLAQQGDAVLLEGLHEDVLLPGVGCRREVSRQRRDEEEQQAQAAGEGESDAALFQEVLRLHPVLDDAVQGQEAQHGQGDLQDHEGHGHRPELVIQRQDVETELCKGHEVVPHGHQDGDDRPHDEPPFFLPLVAEQTQDEQEDGDGAHIHGTGREGLGTPVHRQGLGDFAGVGLAGSLEEFDGLGLRRIHGLGRCASVEVRDHQVRQFLPAVGPRRGIVQVQAAALDIPVLRKFGPAAHGMRGIFRQRQKFVHIGRDAHAANDQKQGRRNEEPPDPVLVFRQYVNQFHQRIEQHQDREIVRDLLMVRLNLHTQRHPEEHGPEERFRQPPALSLRAAVRIHQRRQHPREEGDRLHLGVVAHLDDLEIVRAERHGHGAAERQRPTDSEGQHEQESPQQGNEQVGRRTLSGKQQIINGLRIIPAVLRGNGRRGHAAEHGVRPIGRIVRMRGIPLVHLVRHPHISRDIALVHDFPVQHLRYVPVTEQEEKDDGSEAYSDVLQQFLLVHSGLFFL